MRSTKECNHLNSMATGHSHAWTKTTAAVILLMVEVLLLGVQLIYTVIQSGYSIIWPPSNKSLKGEVILVTGSGHGIGRELAIQFAAEGAVLVCWDIDQSNNEATHKLLLERGYKDVYTFTCDVANRDEVLRVIKEVHEQVGEVTILVNNAGIMPCHALRSHDAGEIKQTFNVNVLAHFWTIEACLPSMVKNNHGHIVAISSMCGVLGMPNVVPYCASKFAVRGLMEALYQELRAENESTRKSEIKFTTVYPIVVETGLVKKPRNRFPSLLSPLPPAHVASEIIQGMRRNYKEISIPGSLLTADRIARFLPAKFIESVWDFLGTGLDPLD